MLSAAGVAANIPRMLTLTATFFALAKGRPCVACSNIVGRTEKLLLATISSTTTAAFGSWPLSCLTEDWKMHPPISMLGLGASCQAALANTFGTSAPVQTHSD